MMAMTTQNPMIRSGMSPPPFSLSAMLFGTWNMALYSSPGFFFSPVSLPLMVSRIEVSAWMLRRL